MNYKEKFIDKIKVYSIEANRQYNVLASITIAQAILESDWGRKNLAREVNNLFGERALEEWKGKKKLYPVYEYCSGKRIRSNNYFKVYESYGESIKDHAKFLASNPRYRKNKVFNINDYKGQAYALQRAGYNDDPDYAKSLIRIIKKFKLYRFDMKNMKESFIEIDSGAYISYYEGFYGVNLIIKDYSEDVQKILGFVNSDDKPSWIFTKKQLNDNYIYLKKGANKVVVNRPKGKIFSPGCKYKIIAKAYNEKGQVVAYDEIIVKIHK